MTGNLRLVWSVLVMVVLAGCVIPPGQEGAATAPDARLGATPTPAQGGDWKIYRADSGYEIRYPLDAYSVRDVARPSLRAGDILYPGAKALEPNDTFFYQNPGVVTYKITIAVVANDQDLSLDSHQEQLLAENPIAPYNLASLTGHPIQEFTLDGERAIRVDGIEEGPLRLTAQIVAVHNELVYVLLVEPYEPPPNQAEAYLPKAESPEQQALFEEILSTFKLSD